MKKTLAIRLYTIIIFALLAVYFCLLHPIAIFDTDDWSFIHHLRLPIPLAGSWNPIKVFPEVFMSISSYAGAYLIYPVIGRYCYSLAISNGIFISLILTLYFREFLLLIDKKKGFSIEKSILISIVFACLHFWILVKGPDNNEFLFYAYDMTCIYHYILSTLINAALVMHMIRFGGFHHFKDFSLGHKLVVILWTYLSIFSSLYTNVVLIAYIGVELLLELIEDLRKKSFKLVSYCNGHKAHLTVFVIWLCALAIERTGGRAEGGSNNILFSLLQAYGFLFGWVMRFNLLFIGFAVCVVAVWCFFVRIKKTDVLGKYLLAMVLTALYIVMLSAVVDGSYVGRVDVILPVGFWLLLMLMLILADIADSFKFSGIGITCLAVASMVCAIYAGNTYKEINYLNIPYEQCEALADDIILQFKEAENNGETSIELKVPAYKDKYNWPHQIYQAGDFAKAMYRHRVIHTKIDVEKLVPTQEMTEKYITN